MLSLMQETTSKVSSQDVTTQATVAAVEALSQETSSLSTKGAADKPPLLSSTRDAGAAFVASGTCLIMLLHACWISSFKIPYLH